MKQLLALLFLSPTLIITGMSHKADTNHEPKAPQLQVRRLTVEPVEDTQVPPLIAFAEKALTPAAQAAARAEQQHAKVNTHYLEVKERAEIAALTDAGFMKKSPSRAEQHPFQFSDNKEENKETTITRAQSTIDMNAIEINESDLAALAHESPVVVPMQTVVLLTPEQKHRLNALVTLKYNINVQLEEYDLAKETCEKAFAIKIVAEFAAANKIRNKSTLKEVYREVVLLLEEKKNEKNSHCCVIL